MYLDIGVTRGVTSYPSHPIDPPLGLIGVSVYNVATLGRNFAEMTISTNV